MPIGRNISRVVSRAVVAVLVIAAVVWFVFFDSYSVRKRIDWQAEYEQLEAENALLRLEIARLKEELAEPPTDEMIERIAREQYGMRRPGELVYRLETEPPPE